MKSDHEIFREFAALLEKYQDPIINSFIMVEKIGNGKIYDTRLSNGPIESLKDVYKRQALRSKVLCSELPAGRLRPSGLPKTAHDKKPAVRRQPPPDSCSDEHLRSDLPSLH